MSSPISPSAIAQAAHCGWAHENQRVLKLRPGKFGHYLLTGNILHKAAEKWCLDHDLDMVELVKEAWMDLTVGTPANRAVRAYQKLWKQSLALQDEIRAARPDITLPTRTKDFKEHSIGKAVRSFNGTWASILATDDYDWSAKPFTECYDETITVAEHYQERWGPTPESLRTEFKYNVQAEALDKKTGELRMLTLTGIIDCIDLVLDRGGEPLAYAIIDHKTYGKAPEAMKDSMQLIEYAIAADQMLPQWLAQVDVEYNPEIPTVVGLDLMKLLTRVYYPILDSHRRLFLDVALAYDDFRNNGVFLPNLKLGECDRCQWILECQERINLQPVDLEAA